MREIRRLSNKEDGLCFDDQPLVRVTIFGHSLIECQHVEEGKAYFHNLTYFDQRNISPKEDASRFVISPFSLPFRPSCLSVTAAAQPSSIPTNHFDWVDSLSLHPLFSRPSFVPALVEGGSFSQAQVCLLNHPPRSRLPPASLATFLPAMRLAARQVKELLSPSIQPYPKLTTIQPPEWVPI